MQKYLNKTKRKLLVGLKSLKFGSLGVVEGVDLKQGNLNFSPSSVN